MKSQNTKSSDELQKEVRHELHNVKRDIEEIEGRLTPGKIIDDAIFHSHGGSLRGTFEHLKRNPVGSTFLSLGTLLLMEDEYQHSYESSVKSKVTSMKGTVKAAKDRVGDSIRERIPERDPNEPGLSQKTREKFDEMRRNLKVSEEKKAKFKDAFETSKNKVQNLDPTTFMALGLGLGALTGASLPLTDKEKSFVEGNLQERFTDFGDDLQNALNECSNVLKDLVIQDAKDYTLKIF
jgi:hypothetical protein